MRQFSVTRSLFGADITAQVTLPGEGVHVLVCGGTRPHIGAVSVAGPDGAVSTMQFPGHKDGVISSRWAEALLTYFPVVVAAGIHYDRLNREEIEAVVALTDEMLKELLEELHETHSAII